MIAPESIVRACRAREFCLAGLAIGGGANEVQKISQHLLILYGLTEPSTLLIIHYIVICDSDSCPVIRFSYPTAV